MLPSSRRIPRELFASRMKNARTAHSEHFSVRVGLLSSPESLTRLTVVVSSAVEKQAHDRNLLKRRVRSALEARLGEIQNGFASAFFAKKGAGKLPFSEIAQEVDLLLRNSGLVVR